jgi:hypothetical protein
MRRRFALLSGLLMAARPAAALTPCAPGTRPGVLAVLRFQLLLPDGDDVTEAQWRTFRGDIMDPLLRTTISERDEPPVTQPRPQRTRIVFAEMPAAWNPGAPPELPPQVIAVTRAWAARFPAAPVETGLVPACLAR